MVAVGVACFATAVALWALLGVLELREQVRRLEDRVGGRYRLH